MGDMDHGLDYIASQNIPDLLEALMAGVMYNRPENAVVYLRTSLEKLHDMPDKPDAPGCALFDGAADEPMAQQTKKYPWNLFVGNKRRRRVPRSGRPERRASRGVAPESGGGAAESVTTLPPAAKEKRSGSGSSSRPRSSSTGSTSGSARPKSGARSRSSSATKPALPPVEAPDIEALPKLGSRSRNSSAKGRSGGGGGLPSILTPPVSPLPLLNAKKEHGDSGLVDIANASTAPAPPA